MNGTMIDRPNGIEIFRLMSVRGMVRLEKQGMKSRGGCVRKIMALELGLKQNAKHDVVIEAIEKRIEELRQEGDLGIHKV